MGKLIVIEGTDGSGKATQSKLLLQKLEENGLKTAYFDFPQYGTKSAGMAENYLNGKYGSSPGDVDPKVASIFYAIDRYDASFPMKKDLQEGKIVICNRYISANQGHQAGKIRDPQERKKFLEWLEDLEFNLFKIPKPDLTILLLVPYEIAQKLIESKGAREYIGGAKKDIHEASKEHIKFAEDAFIEVAKAKGWVIINCTKNGEMMPIEEIHSLIFSEVNKIIGKN